jgi:hypothetical protein
MHDAEEEGVDRESWSLSSWAWDLRREIGRGSTLTSAAVGGRGEESVGPQM